MESTTKWALGLGAIAVGVVVTEAILIQRASAKPQAPAITLPGKIVAMNTNLDVGYSPASGSWYSVLMITYSDGTVAQQIVPILKNDGSTKPSPVQTKTAVDSMMDSLLRLQVTGAEPTVAAVNPISVQKNADGTETLIASSDPNALPGIKTATDGSRFSVMTMDLSNGVHWYFGVLLLPENDTPVARMQQIDAIRKQLVGKNAADAEKILLNAPDVYM